MVLNCPLVSITGLIDCVALVKSKPADLPKNQWLASFWALIFKTESIDKSKKNKPVVHYNLTKKVVQLSKKDVYLFEYQTYKYNEQLSSKLQ